MSVDFGLMWSVFENGKGFGPGDAVSGLAESGFGALARHDGGVHCVHHDSLWCGGDLWWTVFAPAADEGRGSWSERRRVGLAPVVSPVSLASYRDTLYLAYLTRRSTDDFPVLMLAALRPDGSWESREFSHAAKGQPVLTVHEGLLHLAFHGFDPAAELGEGAREIYSPRLSDEFVLTAYQYDNTDVMYHLTFDGTSWSDAVALPVVGRFDFDLAFHRGQLHRVFRRYDDESRDAAAIMHTVLEGGTWSEPVVLGHATGHGWPVMAVHDDMLYVAWATGGWSGPEEDAEDYDDPSAWRPPAYDASIRLGVLESAGWREVDAVSVEAWTGRPRTPTPALISCTESAGGPSRLLLVYPAQADPR
ncbi:hypothetical protein [Embleya sp. AB8]|uniref:hypothetical protein n=1 Tax=Embleya sp. AB8 TaxID=3156304 RepID=UPI003C72A781